MTPQFKIIAILGLLTVLTVTVVGFHVSEKNAYGNLMYNKAIAEMQDKFYRDLEEKMLHKKELLDNAILESNKWKKEAIRLQAIEPVAITETEVQTIVKNNNSCKRIDGIDVLFNKLSSENFAD